MHPVGESKQRTTNRSIRDPYLQNFESLKFWVVEINVWPPHSRRCPVYTFTPTTAPKCDSQQNFFGNEFRPSYRDEKTRAAQVSLVCKLVWGKPACGSLRLGSRGPGRERARALVVRKARILWHQIRILGVGHNIGSLGG